MKVTMIPIIGVLGINSKNKENDLEERVIWRKIETVKTTPVAVPILLYGCTT